MDVVVVAVPNRGAHHGGGGRGSAMNWNTEGHVELLKNRWTGTTAASTVGHNPTHDSGSWN